MGKLSGSPYRAHSLCCPSTVQGVIPRGSHSSLGLLGAPRGRPCSSGTCHIQLYTHPASPAAR
eukprot:scaffold598_cov318-Pavlova_lutheri.AAC.46